MSILSHDKYLFVKILDIKIFHVNIHVEQKFL